MSNRSIKLAILVVAVLLGISACDYFVSTQARLDRAQEHLKAYEYRAAMIELRTVLKSEPGNITASLLSAELSLQLGDAQSASEDLRRALEHGAPLTPQTAALSAKIRLAVDDNAALLADIDSGRSSLEEPLRSLYRGQALLALNRTADAEQAFKAALDRNSRLTEAHVALATIYAASDTKRALAELDAVKAYDPLAPDAWRERAGVQAARGQYKEAEQSAETALANERGKMSAGNVAATLALLTEVRLAQGNVDGAALAQQKLAARSPNAVMTHYLGARIALLRRDYTNAVGALQTLANAAPDFAPGQRLLGVALLAQGSLLQAEAQLQAYVSKWPDDVDGRKLLAQIELRLDQPQKAREAFVLGTAQDDTNALLNLALFDANSGRSEAATTDLEKIVAADPGNSKARLALAQLAVRRGDLEDARRRLLEMRKSDGKAVEPRLLLAAIDLRTSHAAEADVVIGEALAAAPERGDVLDAVGRIYFGAGRYDDALAKFRAAVELDGGKAEWWLDTARAQAVLNQPAAAQSSAEKALALKPDWIAAVEMLVRVDLASGRKDAAIQRAVALREKRPKEAAVYALEGETRLAAKQYADAAKAYEAAAHIAPSAALATRIYQTRRVGHLGNETTAMEAWLHDHPSDRFIRMMLADGFMSTGKPADAIKQYEQLVHEDSRNVIALNNLAGLYDAAGDSRALATAKGAYALAPKVAAIADTYGWLVLKSGQNAEGLKVLALAAGAAKDSPNIEYHYATALSRNGETAKAREQLKKILADGRPFDGRTEAEALLKKLSP